MALMLPFLSQILASAFDALYRTSEYTHKYVDKILQVLRDDYGTSGAGDTEVYLKMKYATPILLASKNEKISYYSDSDLSFIKELFGAIVNTLFSGEAVERQKVHKVFADYLIRCEFGDSILKMLKGIGMNTDTRKNKDVMDEMIIYLETQSQYTDLYNKLKEARSSHLVDNDPEDATGDTKPMTGSPMDDEAVKELVGKIERGEKVEIDSNLMAYLTLKQYELENGTDKKKYDMDSLKDPEIRKHFRDELQNTLTKSVFYWLLIRRKMWMVFIQQILDEWHWT
jgi:hypothetical protein